jgi:hypothetical protein
MHGMDTEMVCDCTDLGGSSRNTLSTLIEITFCLQSSRCWSYRAVVHEAREARDASFSELARLIESFGPVGKIGNLAVDQLQQHFVLVTGSC